MALAAIGAPFIPSLDQLRPFAAEAWIIVGIVFILTTPFFTRRVNLVSAGIALAALGLALVATLAVGVGDHVVGEYFRGMLVFDRVAFLWKIILLVFVGGVVLLWFSSTARTMREGDGPEFFTLLLGATLGMSLMACTTNLLMIFMTVELASLPSFVLAGFRKTHRVGAEAALKYVLFGTSTAAIMMYGLSILYGLYGTLQLQSMASAGFGTVLLAVAVFGIIIGLGFKISAVPFHFWVPDVFEGTSVDVTTFLSVASKGAGLLLMLRVAVTLAASGTVAATALAVVIGILGSITVIVGNTAAFVQTNIKRLLAYSSIAQAGYMLCAISLLVKGRGAAAEFEPAAAAGQALLLYLVVYAFMNLGAFAVAAVVGERLDDFRGLSRRSPILAACMFCALVSLIGVPPLAGFWAKINLLWVLFENGGWWWSLIVVIAVNTIVSAFYYFRVIKAMYLEAGDGLPGRFSLIGTGLGLVCAVVLVGLFFAFGPLSKLATACDRLYVPQIEGRTTEAQRHGEEM